MCDILSVEFLIPLNTSISFDRSNAKKVKPAYKYRKREQIGFVAEMFSLFSLIFCLEL